MQPRIFLFQVFLFLYNSPGFFTSIFYAWQLICRNRVHRLSLSLSLSLSQRVYIAVAIQRLYLRQFVKIRPLHLICTMSFPAPSPKMSVRNIPRPIWVARRGAPLADPHWPKMRLLYSGVLAARVQTLLPQSIFQLFSVRLDLEIEGIHVYSVIRTFDIYSGVVLPVSTFSRRFFVNLVSTLT